MNDSDRADEFKANLAKLIGKLVNAGKKAEGGTFVMAPKIRFPRILIESFTGHCDNCRLECWVEMENLDKYPLFKRKLCVDCYRAEVQEQRRIDLPNE